MSRKLFISRRTLVTAAVWLLGSLGVSAQTLAHPNWAGSGLSSTPWYRSAIFYSIAVPGFQDSDGDGHGDLAGIAERSDYLQSLGIDAIILSAPSESDAEAFAALQRALSARHIRIVVELSADSTLLENSRRWLARGVAGISVQASFLTAADEARARLPELRVLVRSFPGERVLIVRTFAPARVTTPNAAQLVTQVVDAAPALLKPSASSVWDAPRSALPAGSTPLLETGDLVASILGSDARGLGLQKFLAARLLTSPGAARFRWGQELGLEEPANRELMRTVMQWTPLNITPKPVTPEVEQPKPPAPSDPAKYGSFQPYVAPKPKPKPLPPGATPPLESLRGFTSGTITADPSPNAATANVAVEDASPISLLNFYRRLAQLHHDHPALRSGAEVDFDHATEKAVVWLRHAPDSTRTAHSVVVVCNLGDQPLTLSLDADLAKARVHSGALRPLLASWTATPMLQYTNHITLPPYSVYVGEVAR